MENNLSESNTNKYDFYFEAENEFADSDTVLTLNKSTTRRDNIRQFTILQGYPIYRARQRRKICGFFTNVRLSCCHCY